MTHRERKALEAERAAARSKLRTAESAAHTAIGQLKQDASTFGILAGCEWMKEIDPDNTGPRMVCDMNAKHLTKLADRLTAQVGE